MPARPSASVPAEAVPAGNGTRRQVLIGPDVGPNFALRKFIMEPGGGMPLHTNEVEHEQYVLAGRARVVIGEEVLEVQKDDVVFIPGRVPHSYETMGDEPFEFLCVVPNLPDKTRIMEGQDSADADQGAADADQGAADADQGAAVADRDAADADRDSTSPGRSSAVAELSPNPAEAETDDSSLIVPEDELGC